MKIPLPPKRRQKGPQKTDKCESLLDIYHKEKICSIPVTSLKKKECKFGEYRPKPGKVLDYNISETKMKWDTGIVKVSLKQTVATYVLPKKNPDEESVQTTSSRSTVGSTNNRRKIGLK